MTERELRAVAEAIYNSPPHNPNKEDRNFDVLRDADKSDWLEIGQAAISASDSRFLKGLVEALKVHALFFDDDPMNAAAKAIKSLPEDLR